MGLGLRWVSGDSFRARRRRGRGWGMQETAGAGVGACGCLACGRLVEGRRRWGDWLGEVGLGVLVLGAVGSGVVDSDARAWVEGVGDGGAPTLSH